MSESEILPFQDANGDGLNDACDNVLTVTPPKDCPKCVPNSTAIVPSWIEKDIYDPFLNEQSCSYQITVTTKYTSTLQNFTDTDSSSITETQAEEALEEIYEEHVYTAIEALLESYNKATTSGVQMLVYEMIERTDWDLSIRKFGRLKLLYSVPSEAFDALPDAVGDEDEDSSNGDVSFNIEELITLLLQVRKGLWLYARNLKVYRKIENSNILFMDNSVFNLDEYGDWGVSPNASRMGKLLPELDTFLNNRGLNIRGTGGFFGELGNNKRTVSQLTFTFEDDVLEKLVVEAEGCREEPLTYTGKLITLKKRGSVWTDKTAMHYLANLREMTTDLTARTPTPWIDFLIEYTSPRIYTTANSQYDHSDQTQSCIGAALLSEGKQLGENILDEVFSLGDAIAYKFHEQLCAKSTEEIQAIKEQMELYLSPWAAQYDSELGIPDYSMQADVGAGMATNVKALATEQAYLEMEADDEMFADFCGFMFGEAAGETSNRFNLGVASFQELRKNFDRLKLCGLLDMMVEGIQCLFSGLSLDAALGKMIEAALSKMSVKNLSNLFVGLPADKQAEIAALVQTKLQSGDIFKEGPNKEAADATADNYIEDEATEEEVESETQVAGDYWPEGLDVWPGQTLAAPSLEDLATEEETAKRDWTATHEGNYGGQTTGDWESWGEENRSTLAPGFFASASGVAGGVNPNTVVGAYVQAILETYVGDELSLVDLLGNFPGAPIISKILATVTCPQPAYFSPAIADIFKDWQLPICTNNKDIVWPTLMLPPRHKFTDLWMFIKNAAKLALAELKQKILILLMTKLCEILSNAACNSLELIGDLAASAASGNNTLAQTIKDSICGDDVSDEQLANTVTDLLNSFGNGAAGLSDTDTTMDFAMDISSAVTQNEMSEAFLGEASDEFLTVVDGLVTNEYSQFGEAFGDKQAIKKAFENMGNVMPASFRDGLRDSLSPEGAATPSNPSLCATPEQLEDFCENRAALLDGRASTEQIKQQCDNFKDSLLDDLGDLAPIMNDFPGYLENNMPPLVSDPGCDNGILPYEPELVTEGVTAAMGARLGQLKVAYSDDMLGNGPGKRNWGLINMILSDTMGQPLSTHHRKTSNQEKRVDFYKNWTWQDLKPELEEVFELAVGSALAFAANPVLGFASLVPLINSLPRPIEAQRGAYPKYVGEWLREQIGDLAPSYGYNNGIDTNVEVFYKNFEDLPGYSRWNVNKIDFLTLPDMGYNVEILPNFEARYVEFVKLARKNTPDLILNFRDNATGIEDYEFAYGFDIETYFADVAPNPSGSQTPKYALPSMLSNKAEVIEGEGITIINPSDSTRIKIYNVLNPNADLDNAELEMVEDPALKKDLKKSRTDGTTIKERMYEFMAVDDTFDNIDLDAYPTFREAFVSYQDDPPQFLLLKEILNNRNFEISNTDLRSAHLSISDAIHSAIKTEIYDNEPAWLYGATFDSLSFSDAEYIIPDNTPLIDEEYWGGPYQDAVITNPDPDTILPTRGIMNDDMILGVSRMQYEIDKGTYEVVDATNRIFYLDPALYDGTYMNPPVYIKPLQNQGWLGLMDVLFPELSVCKPSLSDLIDFGDIQDTIDELYRNMSDDERLAQDPECALEVPYHRILDRSSKAFIQGLIPATIRIYCSVHLIKALSVFTKFAPKFPEVFSSIFASYVVESMEKSLKDAQGAGWEVFNLFKDEEFWYAFLEQSVETYADKIEKEEVEPPPSAQAALTRLNNMQLTYEYPNREDLKEAKEDEEVRRFKFLKNYRSDKNLEAVHATQEDAKLILKELVKEQLNFMSEKLIQNLTAINLIPDIKDMDYYVLDNFTLDSSLTLNEAVMLDGSFKMTYPDFPTVPFEENEETEEPYYTQGGEFVIGEDSDLDGETKGQEYIGYYHAHLDEETGNVIYMVGEYHTNEAHTVLSPVVNFLHIPIGDVPEYGYGASAAESGYAKPFLVEKYISIDGVKYVPDDAATIVKNNDAETLLSEIYPGTLEIVRDQSDTAIGLTGEFGVRYGIEFSVLIEGTYYAVTSVELDALDRPIGQFTTLSANSGLLSCLINHLRNDETFKLITGYIFPVKKMTALMAIYVDMGLLPSIGEKTVADGEAWETRLKPGIPDMPYKFDAEGKPGMYATVATKEDDEGNTVIDTITIDGNEGWASADDRNVRSIGFMEWDEWDKELLRNSKAKIKRLFKSSYFDRDFDIEALSGNEVSQLHLIKLKEALKFPSGERILPRFRRKRIRSNPFNALGEACEKEE